MMQPDLKCARCGGTDLEKGEIQTSQRVQLRLFNAPFFPFLGRNLAVEAQMCLDCGDIRLTGGLTRAREMFKK